MSSGNWLSFREAARKRLVRIVAVIVIQIAIFAPLLNYDTNHQNASHDKAHKQGNLEIYPPKHLSEVAQGIYLTVDNHTATVSAICAIVGVFLAFLAGFAAFGQMLAAQATLKAIIRTNTKQLRPYVFVIDARFTKQNGTPFTIRVQNSGATPAKHVRLWCRIVLAKEGAQFVRERMGAEWVKYGYLGPNDYIDDYPPIRREPYDTFTFNKWKKVLASGKRDVHVFGEILYRHEFLRPKDKDCVTPFYYLAYGPIEDEDDRLSVEDAGDYT